MLDDARRRRGVEATDEGIEGLDVYTFCSARRMPAAREPRADADRAPTAPTASRVVAREDYVVVDLPLELNDLPGDALKFSSLDTDRPRLRTIDGARYVGRYELTVGEQLIVGFANDRDVDARVLATTERRLRFTPE